MAGWEWRGGVKGGACTGETEGEGREGKGDEVPQLTFLATPLAKSAHF